MHHPPRTARLLTTALLVSACGWAGQGFADNCDAQCQDVARSNNANHVVERSNNANHVVERSEVRIIVNGEEIDPADAGAHGIDFELLQGADGIGDAQQLIERFAPNIDLGDINFENIQPGQGFSRVIVNGEVVDGADAGVHGIDLDQLRGIDAFDDMKQRFERMARQMGFGDIDLDNLQPGQTVTRVFVNGEEIDPADAAEHGIEIEAHSGGAAGGHADGHADGHAGGEARAE